MKISVHNQDFIYMLNLQELAQKLDSALANETPESLTNWLLTQRAKAEADEDGQQIELETVRTSFVPSMSRVAKFEPVIEETIGYYNYAMAA